MSPYTLLVLSLPHGTDALLVVESSDGVLAAPCVARDSEGVREFLAANGMPNQISANAPTGVSIVRRADARLFHVPATVLKPKELLAPLTTLVFRPYRQ